MDLLKALAISFFLLCTSSRVHAASTKQQKQSMTVPVQQQLEPFAVVTTAITQRQQKAHNGRYANINKSSTTTTTSKEQQLLQEQQSTSTTSTLPKEQTAPRRQRKGGRLLDRSFQWQDFDVFGLLTLNGLDHRS